MNMDGHHRPNLNPTQGNPALATPVLELTNVWKLFNGVAVLKGVDLALYPGQVHALLGGNGAGKSTLMKIVSGLYKPDTGSVRIKGQELHKFTPREAHKMGVYLVPQEPLLFPSLSVLENITLKTAYSPPAAKTRIQSFLQALNEKIDLATSAANLTIAEQQIIEILRGLIRDASILILDEPTSALTPKEASVLFERIKKLAAKGVSVVFISHKLNEVREIADRISILRDGRFVLSDITSNVSDSKIVDEMTRSREESADLPIKPSTTHSSRTSLETSEVLRVERLTGEGFSDISFSLKRGEILGLAGVVGSGRTELAETLFGLRPINKGEVYYLGQPITKLLSPHNCFERGIVYLPEDRKANGLFLDSSVQWNVASAILSRQPWWLQRRQEAKLAQGFSNDLAIVCHSLQQRAASLSGGNQQKVLLAKCLALKPKVLILDEPTRGVDVKTRNQIYNLIKQLAGSGMGIILISSDLEEVTRLSDRVLVIHHGHEAGTLQGAGVSTRNITQLAFGISQRQEIMNG